MTYHVHFGQKAQAEELVKAFHYSGRMPSAIQVIGTSHEDGGLFGDQGRVVAACVMSIPPTRWSEPVLELSRLVRLEGVNRGGPRVTLTSLISATSKRAVEKGWDLLVSYADWSEGHHGGVYQAASWRYAGQRQRTCDGILMDGEFIAGRSCYDLYGTRSIPKLQERFGARVQAHYDEGKHLYYRPMNRRGRQMAKRLGLDVFPYPKPAWLAE